MGKEIGRVEQSSGAGAADAGAALLEGLTLGQVPIDLVARPQHVAVIEEIVPQRGAERGRQRITELKLKFRNDAKPIGPGPALVGRLRENTFGPASG